MEKIDWTAYQQALEGDFWLNCNEDDLKEDKEVQKLYKYLMKQRKRVRKIEKLANKTLYPRTELWIREFLWLVVG